VGDRPTSRTPQPMKTVSAKKVRSLRSLQQSSVDTGGDHSLKSTRVFVRNSTITKPATHYNQISFSFFHHDVPQSGASLLASKSISWRLKHQASVSGGEVLLAISISLYILATSVEKLKQPHTSQALPNHQSLDIYDLVSSQPTCPFQPTYQHRYSPSSSP